MALLVDALAAHRLITLVGPGGVGKTSLGLELARTAAAGYSDGVHVVELVSVVDEEATSAAFATAIDVNLRRSSSIDDAIVEMLRPRHSLLLLDNCEHLIEPVAALVSRILSEAPSVSVVATSREPLAVAGEQVWSVEPLSTAAPEAEISCEGAMAIPAVALFVARARAADPTFVFDDATARLVVEICRRLDGIPLAIELAAARARAIGVVEIAHRLDERFGLLKAMRRGSDPRHRTMRDAISWSYDMLEPDERELFTALSVFAGSFDLRSAEAVSRSGDTLDLLTRLTERSMLSVRPQAGGATRYELLETLRDYGRTRLDDERAVELFTAHAVHFAAEAAAVATELRGPDEPRSMARAESSFADLRSAQRFALEIGALDQAFGLIASIREFAMRAMRYEVFAWADAACRAPGAARSSVGARADRHAGVRRVGPWRVRPRHRRSPRRPAGSSTSSRWRRAVWPSASSPTCSTSSTAATSGTSRRRARSSSRRRPATTRDSCTRATWARWRSAPRARTTRRSTSSRGLVSARRRPAARRIWRRPRWRKASPVGPRTTRSKPSSRRTASPATAGNRWMSAFAHTEASGLLVARGDVDEGCAGLAEMLALWYRAGDWSQQWHTLSRCVIALHRVGNVELAMELVGTIETYADARRRADDVDPARRRVRHAGRADRRARATHEPPSFGRPARPVRSTTSFSAPAAPCSRPADGAEVTADDSATRSRAPAGRGRRAGDRTDPRRPPPDRR